MRPIYFSSCLNKRSKLNATKRRCQERQVFGAAAEELGRFRICWHVTRQLRFALPVLNGCLIVLDDRHLVCSRCEFLAAISLRSSREQLTAQTRFTLKTAV